MNNDENKSGAPLVAGSSEPKTYSVFWPLVLTLAGLILLLSWNLYGTLQQRNSLQGLKFQLMQATAQSVQAEQKLRAMLSDLMELVAQDADAAAIIKKYKIQQNAPAPQADLPR